MWAEVKLLIMFFEGQECILQRCEMILPKNLSDTYQSAGREEDHITDARLCIAERHLSKLKLEFCTSFRDGRYMVCETGHLRQDGDIQGRFPQLFLDSAYRNTSRRGGNYVLAARVCSAEVPAPPALKFPENLAVHHGRALHLIC